MYTQIQSAPRVSDDMTPHHLSPDSDNTYYKDNLLALVEALQLLDAPVNTGDWYGEFVNLLKASGADSSRANFKPSRMALDIYRAARDARILDIMALLGKEHKA